MPSLPVDRPLSRAAGATQTDPRTNRVVAKIEVGFSVHGLAVDEESAWVLDEHGFAIVRIDPKSNQLQERNCSGTQFIYT